MPLRRVCALMLSALGLLGGCTRTTDHFVDDDSNALHYEAALPGETVSLRVYPSDLHALADGKTHLLIDILAPQGRVSAADTPLPVGEVDYSESPNATSLNELYRRENAGQEDIAVAMIALPGIFGSGGEFSQSDAWDAVDMIDAVIDQLKAELPIESLAVSGHSAAGRVAAGLLWRREDIGCTVIGHAVTRMQDELERQGWSRSYTGAEAPIDLSADMDAIPVVEGRRMMILSDPLDPRVPFADSEFFAEELQARGHSAELYRFEQPGPEHHGSVAITRQMAIQCLQGWTL